MEYGGRAADTRPQALMCSDPPRHARGITGWSHPHEAHLRGEWHGRNSNSMGSGLLARGGARCNWPICARDLAARSARLRFGNIQASERSFQSTHGGDNIASALSSPPGPRRGRGAPTAPRTRCVCKNPRAIKSIAVCASVICAGANAGVAASIACSVSPGGGSTQVGPSEPPESSGLPRSI